MKGFFNWIEGLRGYVIIFVATETEIIFHLGGLRKKYLTGQILSSKIKILLCIFMKVIFRLVNDNFKWNEGLPRSLIILVGYETEVFFHLGGLRKTYLTRCQNSSSKKLLCSFMKSDFRSSERLFQLNWAPAWICDNLCSYWNRDNFASRWSTKKVVNTSYFELKN